MLFFLALCDHHHKRKACLRRMCKKSRVCVSSQQSSEDRPVSSQDSIADSAQNSMWKDAQLVLQAVNCRFMIGWIGFCSELLARKLSF